MALIGRPKGNFDFISKTNLEFYYGKNEKESFDKKIYKKNIGFNSTRERIMDYQISSDSYIGPGHYFPEKHTSFLKKTFSHNNIEDLKENQLYKMSLFHLMNESKYQKLQEIKALNIDKGNSSQVKNTSNIINYKNKKNKKNLKFFSKPLTKNSINSYSSSNNNIFGYAYDNGIPLKIDQTLENTNDKNFFSETSIINNNIISKNNSLNWRRICKNPLNSYFNKNRVKKALLKKHLLNNSNISNNNTIIPNNKNTNKNNDIFLVNHSSTNNSTNQLFNIKTTSTDKSSKILFTNKYLNSVDSFLNDSNFINNSTIDNNSFNFNKSLTMNNIYKQKTKLTQTKKNYSRLIPKIKTNRSNIKVDNKNIQIKDIDQISEKEIQDIVLKALLSSEPGPGYYLESSIFDKYKKYGENYKNFDFGRKEKRKLSFANKSTNESVGPGSYFIQNNDIKKKNKSTPMTPQKVDISIKDYLKKIMNSSQFFHRFFMTESPPRIGPGDYEYKSQFNITQKSKSGSNEKRFFDVSKKIEPGPGEYLPLSDWKKNREFLKKKAKFKKIKYALTKIYKKKIKEDIITYQIMKILV